MKKTAPFTDTLVGHRVRITSRGRYGDRCIDRIGTVRMVYGKDSIAVDVDFVVNESSTYGYFYFKASELEVITLTDTKETEEKGETIMNKLTNYLNVACIQFLNDDTPFRTIECANYNTDLRVNDLCVVKTANHGMGLAEVVEIKDTPKNELCREIVCKVDTSDFDYRVARRKEAAELKAKMRERAKQLQDIAIYQMLAKEDNEMAEMLKEYTSLMQN